jgi:hypothetical protein
LATLNLRLDANRKLSNRARFLLLAGNLGKKKKKRKKKKRVSESEWFLEIVIWTLDIITTSNIDCTGKNEGNRNVRNVKIESDIMGGFPFPFQRWGIPFDISNSASKKKKRGAPRTLSRPVEKLSCQSGVS